jgi:hypothetical protein
LLQGKEILSSPKIVQASSGAQPPSYSVGTRLPSLGMRRNILLLLYMPSWLVQGQHYLYLTSKYLHLGISEDINCRIITMKGKHWIMSEKKKQMNIARLSEGTTDSSCNIPISVFPPTMRASGYFDFR